MKETGLGHWNNPNTGATNESGFSGLPGGYRDTNGSFSFIREDGYWWSSTQFDAAEAWYRVLFNDFGFVFRAAPNRRWGLSVRCLMDSN